ncbi:hypothetical protein BC940DRAFT_230048 [Gongronella butleri]|nr:hypothetical protein BC940DRAFT_230048 [Gongronella butleri]
MTFLPKLPLFENALKYAQDTAKVAIDDVRVDKQFTYGHLVRAAGALAARLLDGKTDLDEQRVAILCPSGFAYVVCQWAIWAAGGVAVPVCTSHPAAEQIYTLTDAQATLLLAHDVYAARTDELVQATRIDAWKLNEDDLVADLPELKAMDASRRAMIIYTSGTTGKPKGAVSTHDNMDAQTSVLVDAWHWTGDDRIYHILPLHHVHGIINALCCPLYAGATVEMHEKFDAKKTWQRWVDTLNGKPRLSTFMTVPTVYAKLIAAYKAADNATKQQFSAACKQFRFMVSGSASLPTPLRDEWHRISGHVLLERYGMTAELGMALSQTYDDRREGTVGFPLAGVETRLLAESIESSGIFDKNVTDERDTPGMLYVKGRNVFKEYWQRPEATAKEKIDGWFSTGDLAMRTQEKGYYKILGRSSIDIIKTGGEKVSALEIEREILSCPSLGVADVAVVGVPNPEWGQRVAAVVVLDENKTLDLDVLRATLKTRLAVYKVPSLLHVVQQLPKNAMGKVTKKDLLQYFVE